MELFSEIYSCYYQVMRHLLSNQNAVSMQDIRAQISAEGFIREHALQRFKLFRCKEQADAGIG